MSEWVVEAVDEGEVGERGGKRINWVVEPVAEDEVGEGRREVNCMVEVEAESEVSEVDGRESTSWLKPEPR